MSENREKFNPEMLNKAIEDSGMKIPEIAEKASIAKTTIYDWVNGRTIPKVGAMKRIAEVLGVPMENIILMEKLE